MLACSLSVVTCGVMSYSAPVGEEKFMVIRESAMALVNVSANNELVPSMGPYAGYIVSKGVALCGIPAVCKISWMLIAARCLSEYTPSVHVMRGGTVTKDAVRTASVIPGEHLNGSLISL